MRKVTLGGDRLGSGNRMKVALKGYERSTHDLGYLWRSTMSAGTLVPFMSELALPGDTFDIDLDCDIKTHPTVGPLFGSFKVQLDTFLCPIRLYQGKVHNNKLGIGNDMAAVKLPLMRFKPRTVPIADVPEDLDNSQVNPSCILAYLGLRGFGIAWDNVHNWERDFNAVPYLCYTDIYKNYYANKQEEGSDGTPLGYVIHATNPDLIQDVNVIEIFNPASVLLPFESAPTPANQLVNSHITIVMGQFVGNQPDNQVVIQTDQGDIPLSQIGTVISISGLNKTYRYNLGRWGTRTFTGWKYTNQWITSNREVSLQAFRLAHIDDMRESILADVTSATAFIISSATTLEPYRWLFEDDGLNPATLNSQEGLLIKTYQSDLFNNWLNTDWIDGAGGINELTAIDTSSGSFELNTLLISRKVYDILNRIAVSGGTYQDWIEAVYDEDDYKSYETPIYMGGLIKELVFQEVISNSEAMPSNGGAGQPLGTLAGRGIMGKKHKGGHVVIKVAEPSYIMGIISLTPRIDYSQGNKWDMHLKTYNDFHQPGMDEIGFQELITEQMAWWSTNRDAASVNWIQRSAGKQPAWVNYMTNVNRVYGNFAVESNEMFMILNRRYQPLIEEDNMRIDDLTTYVDPAKFNHIFAQTSLDSQNFWVQIAVDITARRKMSAKLMPNL